MEKKITGRVVLKSIPTKAAAERVADYLKKAARNVPHEKIIEKIAQAPTTLFKNVSAETGKKIAADLIRLGAAASFAPFAPPSHHASNSQEKKISNDQIGSVGFPEDQDSSSPHPAYQRRSIVRRWSVAIVLSLSAVLLLYNFYFPKSPSNGTAANPGRVVKKSDLLSDPPNSGAVRKTPDSHKIEPSRDRVAVAEKQTTEKKDNAPRIGIYIFSANIQGLGDLPFIRGLTKRLAETYADDPDLIILERQEIDQVIKEKSMSVQQMLTVQVAADVGRRVGADVLILGRFIRKDDQNKVIKRSPIAVIAINTATARTIDIGYFQLNEHMLYDRWFSRLAKFVKASAGSGVSLDQRQFMVLGNFVDRNNHPGHFNEDALNNFLFNEFGDRAHVCVISQRFWRPFLDILNLNHIEFNRPFDPMQPSLPAYALLNAEYAFNHKADIPFSMELQVEIPDLAFQKLKIKGNTWEEGLAHLGDELDILLSAKSNLDKQHILYADKSNLTKEHNRLLEARAHFVRGRELSNIIYHDWPPYLNVSRHADGQGFDTLQLGARPRTPDGKHQELSPERKLQNIHAAINEFESTLFLEPGHNEARLLLAACLSHPAIGEYKRSKDLLYQVVSNAAEDKLKFIAAKAIGVTESTTYSPYFRQKLFTPEYYADTYAADLMYLIYKDDHFIKWWLQSPAEVDRTLKAIEKSVLAQCENLMWQHEKKSTRKAERALADAGSEFRTLTFNVPTLKPLDDFMRALAATIRKKYPQVASNLIVDSDIFDSTILLDELLLSLKQIEQGAAKPILPDKFFEKLHENLSLCAYSDKKEYLEAGIQIANFIEKHNTLSPKSRLELACCYKGTGQLEKALSLLKQVEGASAPQIRQAFLENPCFSFWKSYTAQLEKIKNPNPVQTQKTRAQTKRSIPPAAEVPADRIIHAIARHGDSLWICANIRQNPYAPSGRYDPVIYRYRPGMEAPLALNLPEKITGMATSIAVKNNTLWVGTDEGLLEIEPGRNAYRHLKEADGLLKPNINSLSLHNKKLYIGLGSGVGYLDLDKHRFTGLMTTNDVIRVAAGAKDVWAVTQSDRLVRLSGNTSGKDFQSVLNCSDAYSLAADHRYVVIGKNLQVGRTFGTRNVGRGGIVVYDLKLKKTISISGGHNFAGEDVLSLTFVGDRLWVGGRGFLAIVDIAARKLVDQLAGPNTAFHALLPDNHGGIWVSQGYKLYHLAYGPDGFVQK